MGKTGSQDFIPDFTKGDIISNGYKELINPLQLPRGIPFYRAGREKYKDVIESAMPDILIEDDCRSIGGAWQLSMTHVGEIARGKINSIIVREFKGIDHLPDKLNDLLNYKPL